MEGAEKLIFLINFFILINTLSNLSFFLVLWNVNPRIIPYKYKFKQTSECINSSWSYSSHLAIWISLSENSFCPPNFFLVITSKDVFKMSFVFWLGCKFPKSELFGYTETFITAFLKHFKKWLVLQININLLKSGIRKDLAVFAKKESMNKNSPKIVFLRF